MPAASASRRKGAVSTTVCIVNLRQCRSHFKVGARHPWRGDTTGPFRGKSPCDLLSFHDTGFRNKTGRDIMNRQVSRAAAGEAKAMAAAANSGAGAAPQHDALHDVAALL